MQPCKCGSFAINENAQGRKDGKHTELCDVCYWRAEYELMEQLYVNTGCSDYFCEKYNRVCRECLANSVNIVRRRLST